MDCEVFTVEFLQVSEESLFIGSHILDCTICGKICRPPTRLWFKCLLQVTWSLWLPAWFLTLPIQSIKEWWWGHLKKRSTNGQEIVLSTLWKMRVIFHFIEDFPWLYSLRYQIHCFSSLMTKWWCNTTKSMHKVLVKFEERRK